MSLTSLQLPPPATWQAFEALCRDLFSVEWGTRDAYRHGRPGQRQYGVDIVGRVSQGWVGVQCKNIGLGGALTEQVLRESVTEARQFRPALVRLSVATTARKDETLQRLAREITDEHLKDELFEVHIVWWEEICARLDLQPHIVAQHFPMLARFHASASTPSTDFSVRIDNFSAQYLGSASRSIPFGGRDRELAELDRWLESDAEPYRLIRAGAGRGKSALIVQWLHQLVAPVAMIFMPISVRFRTNLAQVVFPSMLARLAVLHDQAVPDVHDLAPEVCRSLVSDLLARPLPNAKRLLLVIDGLDEAGDFELGADFLPIAPPAGLKVLLSGRPTTSGVDPLAHLVNGKMETLSPLAETDAQRIAIDAGIANDIAAHVVRLSDGDPLLLRHYVEGLVAGEIHPERLLQTPPGMRGFFEHWWRDQITLWAGLSATQRTLIEEVMCVLSCALAPMRIDDVLSLLAPGRDLSTLEVDAALARLARLLVGDGRAEALAIAHPRFADYIREEWMPKSKRADVEARFIAWGTRTLEAVGTDAAPSEVSVYLIRNLGAHFERSGQRSAVLFKLTSRRWADCWHTQDPSLAGFLIDVERCRRACVRELQSGTTAEAVPLLSYRLVSCGLASSSVVTMREEIAPAVYVAALRLGYWTPAVVIAHLATIQTSATRREVIACIAPELGRAFGSDLLAMALSCAEPRDQAMALNEVYRYLDTSDRAIAAAGMAQYARLHGWVLLTLTELDDAETAVKIAREITDPVDRAHALASLLLTVSPTDRSHIEQEVMSVIRAHAPEFADQLVYKDGLKNLSDTWRLEAVDRILDAADTSDQAHVGMIREFAAGADPTIVQALIRSAQRLGDFWERSHSLQAIAPLVSVSDIPAYLAAMDPADAGALGALSAHHPGEWGVRALELCKGGAFHASVRGPILVQASRFLDEPERLALAPEIVADLTAQMDARAWDEHDPNWLLADFAESFLPDSSATAISLMSHVSEPEVRAHAAARLYLKAASSDRPAWLEIIRAIDDPFAVIDAHCELARHTSGEARREFISAARDRALATGETPYLIRTAVTEAWDLKTELGVAVLKRALEISLPIDSRGLADGLSKLAPGASCRGAQTALWIATHLDTDYLLLSIIPAYAGQFTAAHIEEILSQLSRWENNIDVTVLGTFMAPIFDVLFDRLSTPQQTVALEMARRLAVRGDYRPLASCAARLSADCRERLVSEIEERLSGLPVRKRSYVREVIDRRLQEAADLTPLQTEPPPLTQPYSPHALTEALQQAGRVSAPVPPLNAQAEHLSRQPRGTVAAGLEAALNVMTRWQRGQFLSGLGVFRSVLSALGGTAAIDAALEAIKENAQTWREAGSRDAS